MPDRPTPRAPYARSILTLVLALLASATIVSCQPGLGTAGADSRTWQETRQP